MKNYLLYFLVSLVAILTPVVPILLTVGSLITIDFIIGIWRAFKMKEPITSRKMGNTISKMLLYQLMIISLFLLETFILTDILPFTKIGAALISIVEIKSISESIEKVTGINIWTKITKIIKRGQSQTKDFL
jgi:hypothetical protein